MYIPGVYIVIKGLQVCLAVVLRLLQPPQETSWEWNCPSCGECIMNYLCEDNRSCMDLWFFWFVFYQPAFSVLFLPFRVSLLCVHFIHSIVAPGISFIFSLALEKAESKCSSNIVFVPEPPVCGFGGMRAMAIHWEHGISWGSSTKPCLNQQQRPTGTMLWVCTRLRQTGSQAATTRPEDVPLLFFQKLPWAPPSSFFSSFFGHITPLLTTLLFSPFKFSLLPCRRLFQKRLLLAKNIFV